MINVQIEKLSNKMEHVWNVEIGLIQLMDLNANQISVKENNFFLFKEHVKIVKNIHIQVLIESHVQMCAQINKMWIKMDHVALSMMKIFAQNSHEGNWMVNVKVTIV